MSYTKIIGYFPSSDNITTLTYYIYTPNVSPKAILQISHGMCEYIERYEEFIEYLTNLGILVCGHNHLGHKESIIKKEYLGYFHNKKGYLFLIKDLYHMTMLIKKKYSDLPYFLFGHSMGSFILRSYLGLYSNKDSALLTGAIICGTGGTNPFSDIGITIIESIKKQKGALYRSNFIHHLMFGNYLHHIKNPRTSFDWLTKDTNIVDDYINDPYCNMLFTLNGFENLIQINKLANSKHCYEHYSKTIPIYLISGAMDPVGNYGKGVLEVYQKLKEQGLHDVTLRLYPGDRHEILNELDRQQVYENISNWVFRYL